MPFKSQAQKGWMYANKPEMAKEWQAETPPGKLPKHVKDMKKMHKKMHPKDDKETPEEEKAANEEKEPSKKKKKKGVPHVRYEPKGAKRGGQNTHS